VVIELVKGGADAERKHLNSGELLGLQELL